MPKPITKQLLEAYEGFVKWIDRSVVVTGQCPTQEEIREKLDELHLDITTMSKAYLEELNPTSETD